MSKKKEYACDKCKHSNVAHAKGSTECYINGCNCTAFSSQELILSIPRSSLPALPENLKPPFVATGSIVGDKYSLILRAIDSTEATFLAALLNAVYGGGEGKS